MKFRCAALLPVLIGTLAAGAAAQGAPGSDSGPPKANRAGTVLSLLGGGAAALGLHEGGHLLFDVIFDADPGIRRVVFHGIPFFAIRHRPLSHEREFAVSSAGFWVQHAGSEWLLSARPRLRFENAPFAKGILAFNIGASIAYAGVAFARTGPGERDTRGMAVSAGVGEGWVGALVLAPAVLDGWRYVRPDAKWAVWTSRVAKVAGFMMILKAAANDETPSIR